MDGFLNWRKIIWQHVPDAIIFDSALKYPITDEGWEVEFPTVVKGTTVLVLQDMLTWAPGTRWPRELEQVAKWQIAKGIPSEELIVLIWNYDLAQHWNLQNPGLFRCIQFSTHQFMTWQSFVGHRELLEAEFSGKGKKFTSLCLNRTDKPHRRAAFALTKRMREVNSSYLHWGIQPQYTGPSMEEYDYDNLENLVELRRNYETARMSLVTESQYWEPRGIISEKTFSAIVALHPFIIVGAVGSLAEVRRLGFKTYDGLIDEGYDIMGNGARLDAAVNNPAVRRFRQSEQSDEIAHYNRDYFFDHLGDKLLLDLSTALSILTINV